MSNCETYRELLVESIYDEIDGDDERRLQTHLADCAECAARQRAFGAVRTDLQGWEVEAPPPARVTFITTAPPQPRINPWTRRLAAAASFVVGFLLIAAMANLEIHNSGDGWTIRTSLIPRASEGVPTQTAGDAQTDSDRPRTGPVERLEADPPRFGVPVAGQGANEFRVMSQDDLDSWLDQRLQARGVPRGGGVTELRPEQVQPLLDQLMTERDQQIRALIQESLGRAQDRTRDEFDTALTGLYEAFEAQRTNDLLFFAGELGLLQEATGQELQRTNAAIDFLIGLEAVDPAAGESRRDPDGPSEPEQQR